MEQTTTEGVRQDMERTRERMADTISELDARIDARVERVRERLDVVGLVRQHPWAALGGAFAAGLALALTGADRRAASATADAAKAAPGRLVDAAKAAPGVIADAAKRGAGAVRERFAGGDDQADDGANDNEEGLLERAGRKAAEFTRAEELVEEVKSEAERIGRG
jgi:hypothetical protein